MRSIIISSLHVLLALLALVPSAAKNHPNDIQLRLALDIADIIKFGLDDADKIVDNAMNFLATTRGKPKPNTEEQMESMKAALKVQVQTQLDQFRTSAGWSEGVGTFQIYFPLEFIRELYGESAVAGAESAAKKPETRPPPSPPGHQSKWDVQQFMGVFETTRDTSAYATIIDHDAILQSLGWETTTFADYPSVCDSNAKMVLMPLIEELDLPNNFRRYNCERLVEEMKHHRMTGRWSERAVLEEFFFALSEIPPEDERISKADGSKLSGLLGSGKWLSDSDHCSWDGITCGSTTVGPGARGMEEDDEDANKKTRCDGKMDVDQLLNIPCPPKTAVTKIDLTSMYEYLNGTLINNLYMLTNLHRLNLMKNEIRGTVPESFSELKKLEFLDLSDNLMTSQLPRNLPSTLEEVWFENNAFTGSIPDDFSRFEALRFIDMSNNQLTGTIPSYFTEMIRLNSLALAGNQLTGSIPDFDAPGMDVLDFTDNKLTGMPDIFPPDLSELKLGSNQLKGPFPDSKLFETLTLLNVTGNNFTGEVPTKLELDDSEEYFNLWRSFGCDKNTLCKPGHNILCSPGYFSPVGAVSELGPCQVCPLSVDELEKKALGQTTCSSKDYIAGDVDGDGVLSGREWGTEFQKHWENVNTKTCDLPGVSCGGDGEVIAITPNNAKLCAGSSDCNGLPSEIGMLQSLQIIGLSGASKLKGTLPPEWGKLEKLNVLKLDKCSSLTGAIPTEIGNLKSLKILDLSSSGFTGQLPSELGQLSDLTTLNLSLNSFRGSIPSEISEMKSLKQLVLSRCKLKGRIPENIQNLQQLENLELYGNNLTGPIPSNLMGMVSLKRLDMFSNKLTSSLPAELGLLKNLQIIHLKENRLSGTIPAVIGTIDPIFGSSSSLVDLKLGGNRIHGPIPNTLCSNKKIHEGFARESPGMKNYGVVGKHCQMSVIGQECHVTTMVN
eukprot:scaffold4693_cov113-Skeletonema_dohrnii-CCMP3373.AAC.2